MRPTKLDPERHAAIVKALSNGATRKDAAEAHGVRYQTFLNWLARGEKAGRGIYFEFFDAVATAEAAARLKFTAVIAKAAAEGDWRAAETWLKRRDRENWGDNIQAEITGKDGGPIETVVKFEWSNHADANDNDTDADAA